MTAEGLLCHKPCTVSGGGKSEISKSIADAMFTGPNFVSDIAKDFDFVDSTFNSPPGHALQVCEAITRRNLRVQLDTTNFTPAAASSELLSAMKAAGFKSLGITAESASDPLLPQYDVTLVNPPLGLLLNDDLLPQAAKRKARRSEDDR